MALTLNPTLAAAQDGQNRNLILEIMTGKIGADIPLIGQRLTGGSTSETNPNVIYHSSGRIVLVYSSTSGPRYVYTDVGRTSFNFVDIPLPANHILQEAILCELNDGNVGILIRTQYGTSQYLFSMVITPDGQAG